MWMLVYTAALMVSLAAAALDQHRPWIVATTGGSGSSGGDSGSSGGGDSGGSGGDGSNGTGTG